MKIFDCFTFFNELDLLEFRLKLLAPYVDHFVIAESNITFSGNGKPYNFEKHKNLFAKWEKQIIYLQVRQTTDGLVFNPNEEKYNPDSAAFQLEYQQRNALHDAAQYIKDTDLVITGDLDEIPDPAIFKKLGSLNEPLSISMIFHNYFMNCRNSKSEKLWNGSVVCSGKLFKENTPQQLRDNRNKYKKLKNGGWHFSYLGGLEKIKYKIQSFAHTEFNKAEYLDDAHIMTALEKGQDVLKRKNVAYKFVPLDYYPTHVAELMKQYPQFIKEMPQKKSWLSFLKL